MRALVAGASGALGRHVVDGLLASGWAVRALSRTVRPVGDVDWIVADATRPDTLRGVCDGVDVVVSALGAPVSPWPPRPWQTFDKVDRAGNLALLAEAERAGVDRFVYVSVFADDVPKGRYVAAHEAVAGAVTASPIPSTVVRPTGFFTALDAYRAMAAWGLGVVVGDGTARSNPVHDADLAAVIVGAVAGGPATIDVGGPDVLTRRQMAALAFTARGWTPRLLPVPAFVPYAQAAVLRPLFPRVGDIVRFLADVSTHDGIAPAVGTRRLVDWFAR